MTESPYPPPAFVAPAKPGQAVGFFTDSSICIGCKACEVACKQWNDVPVDDTRYLNSSYDNTGELSANSWRHVAFIEQTRPDGARGSALRSGHRGRRDGESDPGRAGPAAAPGLAALTPSPSGPRARPQS